MCELLDNFDFAAADETTLSAMVTSVTDFLKKAEEHFAETVLDLSRSMSQSPTKEEPVISSTPITSHTTQHGNFLDKELFDKVKSVLPTLPYTSTGTRKPAVCLYGEEKYSYSKETDNLPLQSLTSSVVGEVLECVNERLGTLFNSVLVNRYATKNVALGWHKDDEPAVDQSEPIVTLSFGATRRFCISDSPSQVLRKQLMIVDLDENSAFLMKPGLQKTHYHRVDTGRGSIEKECGVRFSLTFRRLIPGSTAAALGTPPPSLPSVKSESVPVPVEPVPAPAPISDAARDHSKCCYGLVFGSSLTKGLKDLLLSRRGKKFAVFTNRGAHVESIKQDVLNVAMNPDYSDICRKCVKSIFVVCGGNDTENLNRDKKNISNILSDFDSLLGVLADIFPSAVVNVLSLIPRRVKYSNHLEHMVNVNKELSTLCNGRVKCKFIDIFTYFLKDKRKYVKDNVMVLNDKLYKKDKLHFSYIGDSILAKVIIGVTYNPR